MSDDRTPLQSIVGELIQFVSASERVRALVPMTRTLHRELAELAEHAPQLGVEILAACKDVENLVDRMLAMQQVLNAHMDNLRDSILPPE